MEIDAGKLAESDLRLEAGKVLGWPTSSEFDHNLTHQKMSLFEQAHYIPKVCVAACDWSVGCPVDCDTSGGASRGWHCHFDSKRQQWQQDYYVNP